ncbi:hypothetical protein [Parasphingorhabdus sp.]|uniref:hypothetical protein n=1 Tax=Parasphingorhabdus sp. TaxID=2709688 RepID=UPI002F92EB09
MEELKPWWASKAIWTGVIGSLCGVAAAIDVLPDGLTQGDVLTVVLAPGIGGVLFRKTAMGRRQERQARARDRAKRRQLHGAEHRA